MQRQALLLTFVLSTLLPLALPSSARAQWPEHSVFAGLPAPVASPSDELAAFTYRMEVLVDQAPPPHASPAQFSDYLTPALERLRQLGDHPPRAANPAETVVIEGIHAHFAEIYAQRIEDFADSLRGVDTSALREVVDMFRTNALMHWREVARVTDPSPNARAWATFAEARMRAIADAVLGPRASTAPPPPGTIEGSRVEVRAVDVHAIAPPSSHVVPAILAEAHRVAADGPSGAGRHPGSMRR